MMSDTFDTVMLAVGRHAVTAGIGLEPVGVQVRYFVLVCVCVVLSSCLSFMARSVRLGRRRRCTVGMQRCKHAAHGGSCRVVARYAHDSAEPLLPCAHQATLRAHRVDGPKLLALDAHHQEETREGRLAAHVRSADQP